ncbi:MAG: hemerythrin family protein [Campylobacterota bacterium]|nr:hemerythrin family protein [Campylobacterota bacterium]
MHPDQEIPWDDKYKLGIRMIDHQHKKLFDLVNRLYDLEDAKSTKEELRVILYAFNDYMQIHFKDEEKYMLSIKYPNLEEHKQIHNNIIENLTQIIQTPAKLSIIKTKMRVVAKRVLVDHIMHEDNKIKLFLQEREDEEIFNITDL